MPADRPVFVWRCWRYDHRWQRAHAYLSPSGLPAGCADSPPPDVTVPAPASVPRCPECERRVREERRDHG